RTVSAQPIWKHLIRSRVIWVRFDFCDKLPGILINGVFCPIQMESKFIDALCHVPFLRRHSLEKAVTEDLVDYQPEIEQGVDYLQFAVIIVYHLGGVDWS